MISKMIPAKRDKGQPNIPRYKKVKERTSGALALNESVHPLNTNSGKISNRQRTNHKGMGSLRFV